MEDTQDKLSVMLYQEDSCYCCMRTPLPPVATSESASVRYPLHWESEGDRECRGKMTIWCQQVVDYFNFSRKIVEITMSFVDRFLATPDGATARYDRSAYQLTCMAAFYTALKIHGRKAVSPSMVARFSNDVFSGQDVEEMEFRLLQALQWRVNPPTSVDFVHLLLDLIPEIILEPALRKTVYDLTLLQTELAISQCKFVTVKASTLSYAALMNSLESLRLDDAKLGDIGYALSRSLKIDCNADYIVDVQTILYEAVACQPLPDAPQACDLPQPNNSCTKNRSSPVSPCAVLFA